MKLYVSGPIKGVAAARDNFRASAEALELSGHVAVDPFDCAPLCPDSCPGETSDPHYDHYLRGDLAAMMTCEGVALLSGWEASPGARIEVATAVAVGIEVRPLAGWMDPKLVTTCEHGQVRAHTFTHLGQVPKLRCPGPNPVIQ